MIKLINIENHVKSLNTNMAKIAHDIMYRINDSEVDIRKEIIKIKHIVNSTHLSVNTVNNKQGRLINDIDNVNRAIKKVAKIGSIRYGNDFDKDSTELYRQITEKPKSAQNKHNNSK